MSVARPFNIPKKLVAAAFRAVKSNAGSAGIDKETMPIRLTPTPTTC